MLSGQNILLALRPCLNCDPSHRDGDGRANNLSGGLLPVVIVGPANMQSRLDIV
jgi:hypothetical protein